MLSIKVDIKISLKRFLYSEAYTKQREKKLLESENSQFFKQISNPSLTNYVTPVLKELRWPPVKSQLYYRDAVLAVLNAWPNYLTFRRSFWSERR